MHQGKGAIVALGVKAAAQRSLEGILKEIDWTVPVIATDTVASLKEKLTQNSVDLLLIDEQFSDQDAFDVIEQLGALVQNTLIVLCADYFSRETIALAQKAHLYDCLQTPFSLVDIQRLRKRSEAQKQRLSTLIVDSRAAARHIVYKLLSESRFNLMISEAESGKLAVSLCKSIPYQILLVDPDTKDWSGPDMIRLLSKQQVRCRIVLMSARDKKDLPSNYAIDHLSTFLKKPFFVNDLERSLHTLLDIPLSNLLRDDFFDGQELPRETAPVTPHARHGNGDSEIVWL